MTSDHATPPEDAASGAFLHAMRRIAASVAVITTRLGAHDHGMTVTSYASVSMEPPLLLVVIHRSGSLYRPLMDAPMFCLNILSSMQQPVADSFSRPAMGESRFGTGSWRHDPALPPRLDGAQAWMLCERQEAIEAGTHAIIIGRVRDAYAASEGEPLLHLNRAYRSLGEM